MKIIGIILFSVLGLSLLILLISFFLFLYVFYSKKRKPTGDDDFPLPRGRIYEPYHNDMKLWIKEAREFPFTDVSILSHDGLTLRGKYYKFFDDAPIELMLHGYRGDSERDLSGGMWRAKKIRHNALVVDQRASGRSDGHIITFGVKEHLDCVRWVDFIINKIDKNAKIILTGVSMGAATVLMAAGRELPPNVIGVLSDCGYSSPDRIIKDVMGKINVPVSLVYPFVALGARIFGGFSLSKYSPLEAMSKTNLPVIFFHGDNDAYVPMQMSVDNYNSCKSEKKKLVITKNAGHCLCYMVDKEEYIRELEEFFG